MKGDAVNVRDAIREMVRLAHNSIRATSLAMGRSSNFLSTTLVKGSSPTAPTLALIARVCGYSLALVPSGVELPAGSIIIDAE